MKFKIKPAEWKIFKELIVRASPSIPSTRHIEAACREHVLYKGPSDIGEHQHINGALVSEVGRAGLYGDMDAADKSTYYTQVFRKGVELTEDGRGYFDFYIYNRYDPDHELIGNAMIYVTDGEIEAIDTILDGSDYWHWKPETGMTVGSWRHALQPI